MLVSRIAVALLLPLSAVPATAQDDAAVGALLFRQLCATCHGDGGKGDGPTKTDPRPRDLTSGQFSFGNTEEAIYQTIRRGIPPHMPAFGASLADARLRSLTRHVLGLMPKASEASPAERRLAVREAAVIARGHLPARRAGELPLARGLLAGIPGGLNAVFRTDDLRLLEVRRGELAERTDWRGRGGTPLALLGAPFFAVDGGDPGPSFGGADGAPVRAMLAATEVDGATAHLEYRLLDHAHRRIGTIAESVALVSLSGGVGLRRTLHVDLRRPVTFDAGRLPNGARLLLRDVDDGGTAAWRIGTADGDPLPHVWLVLHATANGILANDDTGVRAALPAGATTLTIAYLRTRSFDPTSVDRVTGEVRP